MSQHHSPPRRSSRTKWYFLGFLAIAGYFLLTEHRAHVVPYLPFLLLLACPLMHLFMHGGHGGHGGHEHDNRDNERDEHGVHDGCGGHEHTSQRDGRERANEPGGEPRDETKRPVPPA